MYSTASTSFQLPHPSRSITSLPSHAKQHLFVLPSSLVASPSRNVLTLVGFEEERNEIFEVGKWEVEGEIRQVRGGRGGGEGRIASVGKNRSAGR